MEDYFAQAVMDLEWLFVSNFELGLASWWVWVVNKGDPALINTHIYHSFARSSNPAQTATR